MCRYWGVLPHELPPRGTPERVFLETEWLEAAEENKDRGRGGQSVPPGLT